MTQWYPLYRRVGRNAGPDECVKICPPPPQPEFDPWTVQPATSCYTDYAIPAHSRAVNTLNNATTSKKSSRWFYCVTNNGVYGGMNFKDTTFRKRVASPSKINESGKVYRQSPNYAIKKMIKFFVTRGGFSLPERKRRETKVTEAYCWAITQLVGRSWCGRSGSGVLGSGFQLDCLVYTYTVDHMHTQFRLAPELLERELLRKSGSVRIALKKETQTRLTIFFIVRDKRNCEYKDVTM